MQPQILLCTRYYWLYMYLNMNRYVPLLVVAEIEIEEAE